MQIYSLIRLSFICINTYAFFKLKNYKYNKTKKINSELVRINCVLS